MEKIWWVGVFFALLGKYSIPSKDFFLTPLVSMEIFKNVQL